MAKKTFEDNLNKLEDIIDAMESQDIGLDRSIKLYKEGIDLCVLLGKELESAEQKVKILKKTAEDIFEKRDFDRGEE